MAVNAFGARESSIVKTRRRLTSFKPIGGRRFWNKAVCVMLEEGTTQ